MSNLGLRLCGSVSENFMFEIDSVNLRLLTYCGIWATFRKPTCSRTTFLTPLPEFQEFGIVSLRMGTRQDNDTRGPKSGNHSRTYSTLEVLILIMVYGFSEVFDLGNASWKIPGPREFQSWKVNFKIQVCASSQFPRLPRN